MPSQILSPPPSTDLNRNSKPKLTEHPIPDGAGDSETKVRLLVVMFHVVRLLRLEEARQGSVVEEVLWYILASISF
jgi:hypothetical protein